MLSSTIQSEEFKGKGALEHFIVKVKTKDKILNFYILDHVYRQDPSPMQILNTFQEGKKVKFKADEDFVVEGVAAEVK